MPTRGCVGDKLSDIVLRMLCLKAVDSILHFSAEILDETLNGPSSGITERANGVSLNLIGELFQHINLSEVSITLLNTSKEVDHPASALATGCALPTALVFIELGKS